MCTVTIVPLEAGFRLACNRDETRSRPEAFRPQQVSVGGLTAVYPRDPASGGTWVGVNDAGIAMALLNRSARDAGISDRRISRGAIVPALLESARLDDALHRAASIDVGPFNPFTLVVTDGRRLGVATSNGEALSVEILSLTMPHLFTSSSLGDDLVEEPRRRLFESIVLGEPCGWLLGQFRFHRTEWPARSHLGVVMERPDARTVSRTVIEVGAREVHLHYEPLPEKSAVSREPAA